MTDYLSWTDEKRPASKLVITQSVLPRAAEMDEILQRAGRIQKFDKVLLMVGVANNAQLYMLFQDCPDLEVEAVEFTNGNLLEVHEHLKAVREEKRTVKDTRDSVFRMFLAKSFEEKDDSSDENQLRRPLDEDRPPPQ